MRNRALLLILGLAAAAAVGAATARAADLIQPPGATVPACYDQVNGNLRLVNGPADCREGEAFLSWSRGTSQTSFQYVSATVTAPPMTFPASAPAVLTPVTATATCPAGMRAVGGGFAKGYPAAMDAQQFPALFSVDSSAPATVNAPNDSWAVHGAVRNGVPPTFQGTFTLTAYAVCSGAA